MLPPAIPLYGKHYVHEILVLLIPYAKSDGADLIKVVYPCSLVSLTHTQSRLTLQGTSLSYCTYMFNTLMSRHYFFVLKMLSAFLHLYIFMCT